MPGGVAPALRSLARSVCLFVGGIRSRVVHQSSDMNIGVFKSGKRIAVLCLKQKSLVGRGSGTPCPRRECPVLQL